MSPSSFKIGNRLIAQDEPTYIIAEAGVNHNGSLDLAKQLIDVAVSAGADAVKFQTFKTENIITPAAPKSTYHIETTGSDNQQTWFELLKSQELTLEMHRELIAYATKQGIQFLSTPYDMESVDLLDNLGVPAFKIASTDLNNIPLLQYVATKRKPILISTAMSKLEEVRDSVTALRQSNCYELIVFQCTGNYPATLSDTNMRAMVTMRDELDVLVGYSDHTMVHVNPVLAVALGAVAFEKHFTLDRDLPGPDHRMSLTPAELRHTVQLIREAESAMGNPVKDVLPGEIENRQRLRKSIVAIKDLVAGEQLDVTNVAIKRPGTGLSPAELSSVLGRKTCRAIPIHTLISWDDLA